MRISKETIVEKRSEANAAKNRQKLFQLCQMNWIHDICSTETKQRTTSPENWITEYKVKVHDEHFNCQDKIR